MKKNILLCILFFPAILCAEIQTTKNLGSHEARHSVNLNNKGLVNVSSITFQDGTSIVSTSTLGGISDNSVYTAALQDGAVTSAKTSLDIVKSSGVFSNGNIYKPTIISSVTFIIPDGAGHTGLFGIYGSPNYHIYLKNTNGYYTHFGSDHTTYLESGSGAYYENNNEGYLAMYGPNGIRTLTLLDIRGGITNSMGTDISFGAENITPVGNVDGRDISVDGVKLDSLPVNILNSSNTWTAKQTINNDIEIGSSGNQKEIIVYDVEYSTQAWKVRIRNGQFEAEKAN